MRKLFAMAAIAAAALFATPAVAEGFYAGAGYTHYDADDVEVGGVTGRFGYNFTSHFAAEGEATIGVGDDDGVELDNAFGVYGLARLPVTEQLSVHARAGYQTIEAEGGADDDGLAYGIGAQFDITNRWAVRGDYTRLDGDADIDTFGVSAVFKF